MMIVRLAFRNILGAGMRTWLNVLALSFAFVTIIFLQGLYDGMNDQSEQADPEESPRRLDLVEPHGSF